MRKSIHHSNWNSLNRDQIQNLFVETFGEVMVKPTTKLIIDLRSMNSSTLECLENRSDSTVYRIWQTGVVYQLFKPDGIVKYDNYEEYQQASAVDELLITYEARKPMQAV